ncbi:MAG: SixA phosphatase family protein [Ferruginibacter sp.]
MQKIKFLILIWLALPFVMVIYGQNTNCNNHTFYIVRHGEKDTGSNPVLSAKGKKRAGDLYRVLKDKRIDLIFVSQYQRTAMTGDSLRLYKDIETIHYTADATAEALFKKINSLSCKQKNILIIGHSNTLPSIIRRAGVNNYTQKEIPDNEYDNLFVVKQTRKKAILNKKKFGVVSVLSDKSGQMKISQ